MIPYGKHHITDDDIDEVVKVLKSDFITQGPKIPEFEEMIKKYTGAKYAIAVNSATSALHIACKALALGKGDILWTSPITFVASANCALYSNAQIDFVDINPETYNLCPIALEKKLVQAKKDNKLPKIVIPVHLAGQSCDMNRIYELSQEYSFKIIEDASHAIGGKYKNEPIGQSRYSDITIFSFHPVKIITSAEGGMAITNNFELAEKMELLRTHGITRNNSLMKRIPDGPWYYEQIDLGFNYRMSDIHAALGISQMKRIDEYIEKRHNIVEKYNTSFQGLPIKTPFQTQDTFSSFHLYIIRIENILENTSKLKKFHMHLINKKIGVNLHYIPLHIQPYYREMGFKMGDFPQAEKYYREAVSLPIYPNLTEENQNIVIEEVKHALLE